MAVSFAHWKALRASVAANAEMIPKFFCMVSGGEGGKIKDFLYRGNKNFYIPINFFYRYKNLLLFPLPPQSPSEKILGERMKKKKIRVNK